MARDITQMSTHLLATWVFIHAVLYVCCAMTHRHLYLRVRGSVTLPPPNTPQERDICFGADATCAGAAWVSLHITTVDNSSVITDLRLENGREYGTRALWDKGRIGSVGCLHVRAPAPEPLILVSSVCVGRGQCEVTLTCVPSKDSTTDRDITVVWTGDDDGDNSHDVVYRHLDTSPRKPLAKIAVYVRGSPAINLTCTIRTPEDTSTATLRLNNVCGSCRLNSVYVVVATVLAVVSVLLLGMCVRKAYACIREAFVCARFLSRICPTI